MDSGGRKILPRIRPSSATKPDVEAPHLANKHEEPQLNGVDVQYKLWRPGGEQESAPKRKRQHLDDGRVSSQALPSVQHLLTAPPTNANAGEVEMAGPSRLVHHPNGLYYHQGAFIFQAPSPGRDFPARLSHDARELSFPVLEPDLFDVFKHTWYLRQYVRQRRLQGIEMMWDHVMMNDCYGIESVLHTWSSRYEPGTAQYPASMLYKHCLWLYFHRSIQPSHPTTAFSTVVDDGLHYLRTLDGILGNADRSFLLIPIFLLGTTAFHPPQRQPVFRALERVDIARQTGVFSHAASTLDVLWTMMDDGRVTSTWDWERCQSPEITQNVLDRSLVDLIHDPFMPEYRPTRVRSPEPMVVEFDNSRFRPGMNAAPPPPPPDAHQITRSSSGDVERQSPSQPISPNDPARSAVSAPGPEGPHGELKQERTLSQPELAPAGPRPFLAPPPPSASSMHSNSELIQALTRKVAKSKSTVPPCPTCGKELKNPSDAQKHQLQHTKPFQCREPGCTRIQGFATENDLQRHRKSVHGASPRIGNKVGYVCVACPDPSDGTSRKWWPRLDNFKAHIRRKHVGEDEEMLIQQSATPRRPEDTFADSGYYTASDYMPAPYHTPERHHLSHSVSYSQDYVRSAEQHSQEHYHTQQDRDENQYDEDDEDDGPVGPLELSRSFDKRRPASEEYSEDDITPTGDSSRSGSKNEEALLKENGEVMLKENGEATPKDHGEAMLKQNGDGQREEAEAETDRMEVEEVGKTNGQTDD